MAATVYYRTVEREDEEVARPNIAVPRALWDRCKIQAILSRQAVSEFAIHALEEYVLKLEQENGNAVR